MDKVAVSGTVNAGSIPVRGTIYYQIVFIYKYKERKFELKTKEYIEMIADTANDSISSKANKISPYNHFKVEMRQIYLAGGCFWGVEHYFRHLAGCLDTEVCYVNGQSDHTSYDEIKKTDHVEALKLSYNPNIISLNEILLHFFRIIDPCSVNRQGPDVGRQYRSGIYYAISPFMDKEKAIIRQVMTYIQSKYDRPLAVEVEELKNCVMAETYHQDYLLKNPQGYCHINSALIGLSLFPDKNFTKPDDEFLQQKLSILSYNVTQNAATEKPFSSEYEHNEKKGIYLNVVTGEPLFLSEDKYDAGCGWPSFTKAILTETLQYGSDFLAGYERIEVKTDKDSAHLGHVFTDGPEHRGGLRYCINGASLRFLAYEDMPGTIYEDYMVLFTPEI